MPTSTDVIKIVAEHLGLNPEDLDRQTLLQEDLGLGPIQLNDLLSELSLKFNITFDTTEAENLHNIEDLISLIEDNLLD